MLTPLSFVFPVIKFIFPQFVVIYSDFKSENEPENPLNLDDVKEC